MIALFLFFALPVVASYTAYYIIKPEGRTNYGELINPQRSLQALPVLPLNSSTPVGSSKPVPASMLPLGQFKPTNGKWLMLTLGPANCDAACVQRLYYVRQVRKTTGKEMDRVERVWLVTDDAVPDAKLLAEHEGMHVLRANPEDIEALFSIGAGASKPTDAALSAHTLSSHTLSSHIYMVDPLGHLMLRFPSQADPSKMKKDLSKLLRASRMG